MGQTNVSLPLSDKYKSDHLLIPFWCKRTGMLAFFPIKYVMSHKMAFYFWPCANRLQTLMLAEKFRLLI